MPPDEILNRIETCRRSSYLYSPEFYKEIFGSIYCRLKNIENWDFEILIYRYFDLR
jgi:hypothetical protein